MSCQTAKAETCHFKPGCIGRKKTKGEPMRTTALLNLKGGVAKTATTINMAAILAADHKKRVLVVDADSQANATEFLGGLCNGRSTFADMLRKMDVHNPIGKTQLQGVSLLAADESLMDLDLSKVEDKAVDVNCLRRYLDANNSAFDYVLIDCPPAFNAASAAALLAADDVIIPIKLDAFSLRGMGNLMRQVKNMQEINPALRLAGLLPTMTYNSATITEAMRALINSGLPVFPSIRRTPKVDDMTFEQKPLIYSSPRSAACIDYRVFVKAYAAQKGGARRG